MPASLEKTSPDGNVPGVSKTAQDPFFHRRRVKRNGDTEETTLGSPFARVLVAVLVLIGVIVVVHAGADISLVAAIAAALRAAKRFP